MAIHSSMIMATIRTNDSSMKIHDRKLHALLTMEVFVKSVIIFTFQQNQTRAFEKKQNFGSKNVSCEKQGNNKSI